MAPSRLGDPVGSSLVGHSPQIYIAENFTKRMYFRNEILDLGLSFVEGCNDEGFHSGKFEKVHLARSFHISSLGREAIFKTRIFLDASGHKLFFF